MPDAQCTAKATLGGRVAISTGAGNADRLLGPDEADRLADDIRLAARNARQVVDSKRAPAIGVIV